MIEQPPRRSWARSLGLVLAAVVAVAGLVVLALVIVFFVSLLTWSNK
jgi:hypothetical protein